MLCSNVQYLRFPLDFFTESQKQLNTHIIEFYAAVPHLWCDHYGYSQTDVDTIRTLFNKAGLKIAAYTPKAYTYSLLADQGTELAEVTRNYYLNSIAVANSLGARMLVLDIVNHCRDYEDVRLRDNLMVSVLPILGEAEKYNITLLIGRTVKDEWPFLYTPNDFNAIVDEIASKNLRLYLDTAAISSRCETIDGWFSVAGKYISYVRFVDGRYGRSSIWGEGVLPCARMLRMLLKYYDGYLSLFCQSEAYIDSPDKADKKNLAWLDAAAAHLSNRDY